MIEWYFALILIISLFLIMVFIGIPINYSLGLSFIPILFFLSDESPEYVFNLFGIVTFRKLNSIVLVAVPLFILMGQIFSRTNVGLRMYEGYRRWFSWVPGGLAVTTIITNTFVAAIAGGSMISAAATGPVSIPSMIRRGYSPRLAAGSECTGSALAMIIPPSIPLIFYSVMTEQSIGRLFLAGIVPGIILASLFVISILIRVKLNPAIAPKGETVSATQRIKSLPWIAGPGGLVLILLVALYTGLSGVNELAAIGVIGALVLAAAYRELNWSNLSKALLKTSRFIGFFSMIFVCANFMGFGFSYYGITDAFSGWILSLEVHRYVLLVIIMLIYLLIGMIMDASALILVTTPVIFPIITTLGFDPVWFGIILILNLEVGAITPPVGVNLFALKAAIPDLDMKDAIYGSFPFIVLIGAVIILITIFPQIALWLPNRMIS